MTTELQRIKNRARSHKARQNKAARRHAAHVQMLAQRTFEYSLKHDVTCDQSVKQILDGPIDADTFWEVADLATKMKNNHWGTA